jgi:hypothetical protein
MWWKSTIIFTRCHDVNIANFRWISSLKKIEEKSWRWLSSRCRWGSHDDRICLTWTSVLFSLFWYVTTACELLLMPLCFGLRTTTWVRLAPLKGKRFDKYRDFQIQTYALIRSHFGLSTPTSNSYLSLG